jgi:hypothetical protein
LAPGE